MQARLLLESTGASIPSGTRSVRWRSFSGTAKNQSSDAESSRGTSITQRRRGRGGRFRSGLTPLRAGGVEPSALCSRETSSCASGGREFSRTIVSLSVFRTAICSVTAYSRPAASRASRTSTPKQTSGGALQRSRGLINAAIDRWTVPHRLMIAKGRPLAEQILPNLHPACAVAAAPLGWPGKRPSTSP